MIEDAFEVATEFKFDVGEAIFNSEALKDSVDGLSKAADGAMTSLGYLAGGLVAHLGLGSGGLLSILTQSVNLAEQFHTGSMGFLNTIGSNMNVLSGDIGTFNDQLATSAMLMDKVNDVAGKFGLDSNQLASMSQLLSTPLAQRGKAGKNLGVGIDLAKNAMIAGEATGLGHQAVTESLYRGLSPGGSVMGKLFERMANTQAFRQAGIIHPQQLAGMNQDRKMDLLIKSMSELGNNAGFLTERLNSITTVFTMIRNQLSNVLTPIGEALKGPLLLILKSVGNFLQQNGKQLGDTIAKLVTDIFKDPKALLLNLMQIKSAGADFRSALKFTELTLGLRFLAQALNWLGIELRGGLLVSGLRGIGNALSWLYGILPVAQILSFVFKTVMRVFTDFIPLLASYFILFQGLSRARAQAKVSDAEDLVKLAPQIADMALQWKRFFAALWMPFQEFIQIIADIFEPLFKWSMMMEIMIWLTNQLADAMEFVVDGFLGVAAAIHALVYTIKDDVMQLYSDIKSGNFKQFAKDAIGMDGGKMDNNFMKHFNDYVDKNYDKLGKDENNATKSIYNTTNNIQAQFNMREQLEPDRIAFAVTTHLKKLAMDNTQAKGNSIHAGMNNKVATVQ